MHTSIGHDSDGGALDLADCGTWQRCLKCRPCALARRFRLPGVGRPGEGVSPRNPGFFALAALFCWKVCRPFRHAASVAAVDLRTLAVGSRLDSGTARRRVNVAFAAGPLVPSRSRPSRLCPAKSRPCSTTRTAKRRATTEIRSLLLCGSDGSSAAAPQGRNDASACVANRITAGQVIAPKFVVRRSQARRFGPRCDRSAASENDSRGRPKHRDEIGDRSSELFPRGSLCVAA
jgi:hypothetical protein